MPKIPDRHIIAMDLELNQLNGKPKIIEIGFAVAEIETRQIIEKKSFLVNPMEEITPYINTLTGISQAMVCDRPTLGGVYLEIKDWIKQFQYRRQVVEWGSGDSWALKKELRDHSVPDDDWIFGYTQINVKTINQALRESKGLGLQGGLAKSMGLYGLKFVGTKHRAADDAYNTLQLYLAFLECFQGLNCFKKR